MLVQTERTPNPRTMKFIPGHAVAERPRDVARDEGGPHAALYADPRVEAVFLGLDFVAVTLAEPHCWDSCDADLKAAVSAAAAAAPLDGSGSEAAASLDSVSSRIVDVIERHVRPAVAADGGDIVFHGYADGVLTLSLRGACSGCPSSAATLKHGIRNLMGHFVPEVREIREAP